MRRAGGYFTKTDTGTGKVEEWDTFTCQHTCGRYIKVPAGTPLDQFSSMCWNCWDGNNPLTGLICPECAFKLKNNPTLKCFPFQKLVMDYTDEEIKKRQLRCA